MPDFTFNLPIHDPVLIFAIVMLIILLAPLLFNRLKIPGIVGIILAGMVVGPSVLGLLERDETIILLGTVGLLYLMFMAGLSIDLNKFEKLRGKSLTFGMISYFIPQLAALAVGVYILDFSLYSSILLGCIVGSHTLLAYPIASRIGITKNSFTTMSMGGTIVTDTMSLMILAIVAGAVSGSAGPGFWATFATMVTIYTVVVVLGLPALGRWFFRNVRNQANTEFVFLIAVLFITAWFADVVGLAPIIGAFLAGLTLNRLVPESGTLMNRVQFVGNALFIPFFLISVGMLVDVGVMVESWDVWIEALFFTLLVVLGKGSAAKIVQLIFKGSSAEGWTMAGLTIPQAAATLAVTLVGFEIGLFSQTSVNAVVIMILITCMIGPAMVERFGRKVALQESQRPYDQADAPERILVPLANPTTAESLMDLAIMMKNLKVDDPLFPLTVARDSDNVQAQVADSEKMLSHAVVHAAAAEVPVIPVTRIDMNISNGIMRATRELRISDIVIGWNGEVTAKERIFGSILDQLLDQSTQQVLVSKIEDNPLNVTKRTIVAVPPYLDRENGFIGSIRTIKNLVGQLGSDLLVVSTRNNHKILKEFIEEKDPELESEYIILENWSDLLKTSELKFEDEDLFVLLSTRKGTVSWEANLERLPRIVAQNYPKLNFVTIYPNEATQENAPAHKVKFVGSRIIPPISTENVNFNLDDLDAETALRELMGKKFGGNPVEFSQVVEEILNTETDNLPGELPGVVITKCRSRLTQSPELFMGISQKGFNYPGIKEDVHLIILLVSPPNHTTQRNLNILAALARFLSSRKTVKKLINARQLSDVDEILKEAQLKSSDSAIF